MGWQGGATFAPVIGSMLAEPARHWPSTFQNSLFETYPYALPCIIAASLPLGTAMIGIFKLQETRPNHRVLKSQSQKILIESAL